MKANVEYMRKDYEKASVYYSNIVKNHPVFFMAYSGLISSYSHLKKYDKILTVLNNMIENEFTKEDLIDFIEEKDENGNNELESFVLSDVYKTWKTKE